MKHGSAENTQSSERIKVGADVQQVFHCERVFPLLSGLTKSQGESSLDEKANGDRQPAVGALVNFINDHMAIYRLAKGQT